MAQKSKNDGQRRRYLPVMSAVREFGRAMTLPLLAPSGTLSTFIEVPFAFGDQRLYP
jgi:hypothetical protein